VGKKSRSKREEKRDQFIKAAGKAKWPWVFKRVIPLAILALILLGGGRFLSLYLNGDNNGAEEEPKVIEMTEIKASQEGGKIVVPLSSIKKSKLVYFEYKGSASIPLLAYVGLSGKVITAISVCEPCKSTRFHIDGENLVCNICGTVWNLETHQGVTGGCTEFPPQIIPNQVKDGKVLIAEDKVAKWQPRATKLNKDVTI
jgi:hypothetical protein